MSYRAWWDAIAARSSLASVRTQAWKTNREFLVAALQWNDPNASWLDHLAVQEGMDPATKEEAVDAVIEVVSENIWSVDDPRRMRDDSVLSVTSEGEEEFETTWEEFREVNAEAPDLVEISELGVGESVGVGGGAWARFEVRRIS